MTTTFKPYANEADVLRIGDMEIENRVDRVTLTGDLVFTMDKPGLTLAKKLQALLNEVVKTLEANKQLPATVELKPVKIIKNPLV